MANGRRFQDNLFIQIGAIHVFFGKIAVQKIPVTKISLESFRKYFTDIQLTDLESTGPNWGVNVQTVGHSTHLPGRDYPDPEHPSTHVFQWENGRRLQEFQLVYVAKGRGVYEGEDTALTGVEAGTIILLFPGVWHRYKPLQETGWEEFWVGFDGHFAEYLMRQDCFDPQRPLISVGFSAEFLDIFQRLIDVLKYEGVAFRQLSSCLVIQMLGLVYSSALMKNQSRLRQEQIVQAVRFGIHENWEQTLDFQAIAQAQNISYEWLRKAFKKVTGTSPGQYLLNLKIEKTGQMLRETSLTISEIASKTGFESEFYFSKIFKKKTGLSPSIWRRG